MSTKISARTKNSLDYFHKKYGESHFHFLCHVAFPVVLSPHLCYSICKNFSIDESGVPLNFRYIMVSDVLLSSLCKRIGYEEYELLPELRHYLLKCLEENNHLGKQRIDRLAAFLYQYADRFLNNHDSRFMRDTYQLISLAILDPIGSARKIHDALAGAVKVNDETEFLRIFNLLESINDKAFDNLQKFAEGLTNSTNGNGKPVPVIVEDPGDGCELLSISLPEERLDYIRAIPKKKEDIVENKPFSCLLVFIDKKTEEQYIEEWKEFISIRKYIQSKQLNLENYTIVKDAIHQEQPDIVVLIGKEAPKQNMLEISELFPLKDCKVKCALFLYPNSQAQAIDTMWRVAFVIGQLKIENEEFIINNELWGMLLEFLTSYSKTGDVKNVYNSMIEPQAGDSIGFNREELFWLNFKKEKWKVVKTKFKLIINSIGMEFIYIPPGEFIMGASLGDHDAYENEKPVHKVKITQGFYMGKYPVTQKQWKDVMGNNPSYFKDRDNHPVEQVSWNDAQEFIEKLNKSAIHDPKFPNSKYRLPTEAEWEYAARAGGSAGSPTGTKYYFGNDETKLGDYAWYNENSDGKTHPVGQKKPNQFGLYDMLGNVWEWCEDTWDSDYYKKSSTINPVNKESGVLRERVLGHGFSFHNREDRIRGFRLVLSTR